MDYDKIRNMTDEEMEKFFKRMSNRRLDKCSRCGKLCTKTIKIENKKTLQTKSIGGICDGCYEGLLQFLDTVDVMWDE